MWQTKGSILSQLTGMHGMEVKVVVPLGEARMGQAHRLPCLLKRGSSGCTPVFGYN